MLLSPNSFIYKWYVLINFMRENLPSEADSYETFKKNYKDAFIQKKYKPTDTCDLWATLIFGTSILPPAFLITNLIILIICSPLVLIKLIQEIKQKICKPIQMDDRSNV